MKNSYKVTLFAFWKDYISKTGCLGYGFVDFDSPTSAQRAVVALQTKGVQAQMAKVRIWIVFLKSLIL